jgi:hypothetical protein
VPVTEPGRKMMMVKLEEEEDAATEPVLPPPPSPVDADEEDEQTDSVGDGDDAPRPTLGEPALKKGPWTPEEDDRLRDYVQAHGEGNWNQVRVNAGLNRCGKSCRLRWSNHLRPDLKKGPFDDDEVDMILRMHQNWGNKWAKMAARVSLHSPASLPLHLPLLGLLFAFLRLCISSTTASNGGGLVDLFRCLQ